MLFKTVAYFNIDYFTKHTQKAPKIKPNFGIRVGNVSEVTGH